MCGCIKDEPVWNPHLQLYHFSLNLLLEEIQNKKNEKLEFCVVVPLES